MKKERYTHIADKHTKDAYGRDGDISLENGDKFISGTLDVENLKVNGNYMYPYFEYNIELRITEDMITRGYGLISNAAEEDVANQIRESAKNNSILPKAILNITLYVSDRNIGTFSVEGCIFKSSFNNAIGYYFLFGGSSVVTALVSGVIYAYENDSITNVEAQVFISRV